MFTRAKDRRRKRKRRRVSVQGFTLKQLTELVGVSQRTIADYIKRGLLTAPEFRGTATRYQRDHLLRLLAIRFSKRAGIFSIKSIKRRLEAMGSQDIERWVMSQNLEPAVVTALAGTAASPTPPSAAHHAGVGAGLVDGSSAAPSKAPLEVWRRVQLMPGLELALRADAAPVVREVASHVYSNLERLILDALAGAASRNAGNPGAQADRAAASFAPNS